MPWVACIPGSWEKRVTILCKGGPINGVLSFGGVHTEKLASIVVHAENEAAEWESAFIVTGRTFEALLELGVRPGTRIAVHPTRRTLTPLAELVSGHFLDDRADLVAWLIALEELSSSGLPVLFAATTSEEVGGEGAQFLLHKIQPEVCIALELGPNVIDSVVEINDQPTVWASDSYACMNPKDGDLLASIGSDLGLDLQFQCLSQGGSDASCAASRGLCARPITLGIPMENSHGFEIIHPGAIQNLAQLTVAIVKELCK